MKLKSIEQVRILRGKRVLLRLDLNIPIDHGRISPEGAWRLQRAIPTIKYLITHGAKIIILAHLGRPKGKSVDELSLLPISQYLSKLIKKNIEFWSANFSEYIQDSFNLKNGSLAMLENIRFYTGEEKNSKELAKQLSDLADIYVNDAFGNIHRSHTSMEAITHYLPSYAGLLILDEIKYLSEILKTKQDLAIILGGAKVASKIKLIQQFSKTSPVLLGGALATTMLKARGVNTGQSLIDQAGLSIAKKIKNNNIYLPVDVVIAKSPKSKVCQTVAITNIPRNMTIFDIGPNTVKQYLEILKKKKTIIWNGPLGFFENKNYLKSSQKIMIGLTKLKAKTIIGGGETVELVNLLGLDHKFSFVSTGGGAMMSYLQGDKLPVLARLVRK